MKVHVKLFASLRKYAPAGVTTERVIVEVPPGAAVRDAIAALGIPTEHARMIVSQEGQLEPSAPLVDGQQLDVFPPLAGGR